MYCNVLQYMKIYSLTGKIALFLSCTPHFRPKSAPAQPLHLLKPLPLPGLLLSLFAHRSLAHVGRYPLEQYEGTMYSIH